MVFGRCSVSKEKRSTVFIAIACDKTKLPSSSSLNGQPSERIEKCLQDVILDKTFGHFNQKGGWKSVAKSFEVSLFESSKVRDVVVLYYYWTISYVISSLNFENDEFVWNRDGNYSWPLNMRSPIMRCGRDVIIEG